MIFYIEIMNEETDKMKFVSNLRRIKDHNSKISTYKLAMNQKFALYIHNTKVSLTTIAYSVLLQF